jgi:hypothetical protein
MSPLLFSKTEEGLNIALLSACLYPTSALLGNGNEYTRKHVLNLNREQPKTLLQLKLVGILTINSFLT